MPVLPDDFKAAMRRFATGVTVVTTTSSDGKAHGFTANAFASVTTDPPTLLICVNRNAQSHPLIAATGRFCVNILTLDQQEVAERFARQGVIDKFAGIPWRPGTTGSPVIDDALAYFDCSLTEQYTSGTHTIFLGSVVECGSNQGMPLGYFNGTYRDFSCIVS